MTETETETKQAIADLRKAVDAISARLADVQCHPALSTPPLPGFEPTQDEND